MSKTVIFVGYIQSEYLDYFVESGYVIGYFYDIDESVVTDDTTKHIHFAFPIDFSSNQTVSQSLSGVSVNSESLVICIRDRYFSSAILISHLFHLRQSKLMSVEQALEIGNKNYQRRMFGEKAPEITIGFKKIRTFHGAYIFTRKYGFPVIVKPASLSQSQLVYICTDLEDLIKKVSFVLDHVEQVYQQNHVHRKPEVIIEQYIQGKQFSVDSYITTDGEILHTPVCQQTLGYDVGLDNFETIYSIYPSNLSNSEEGLIFESVTKAIQSLDIRGQPTHTEVRLTPNGECKIIEVNIRTGGFRSIMLKHSYNIDHVDNVIKTYLSEKPVLSTKLLKYSACPQFWPEKEGILKQIDGWDEITKLPSFQKIGGSSNIGKLVGPSSKGHPRSCFIILAHPDKNILEQDIQKSRQIINLVVE